MIEIQPPGRIPVIGINVFLAGSIEMGLASEWQKEIISSLAGLDVTVMNPRRDSWDSTWKTTVDDLRFAEQVDWELFGIENSHIAVFYFDPATKSPVSLLELGFAIGREPDKCIVCCPTGFWRKGNVDIICSRNQVCTVPTLPNLIAELKERIDDIIVHRSRSNLG